MNEMYNLIDDSFREHLDNTRQFLRLPGISLIKQSLAETASWLKMQLEKLGADVTLIEEDGRAPLIFAELNSGKPRTLLVYGMYDVQPVEGQRWISDPFAAEIRDLPDIGEAIIARGACNSKAPLMAFINVIDTFKKNGDIPVNLIFIIEGEEETGSPGLKKFILDKKDLLKTKADAGFEPFWAEYGTDVNAPIISLGSKGMLEFDLICEGGDWGGPAIKPLHSSVGAWISSPVWRLLKAVNTLMDENENLLIAGIYDDLIPPSVEDERLLKELAGTFDEDNVLKNFGSARFKITERGIGLLRKYLFSPSLHIGTLTNADGDVIMPKASIRLLLRLASGMKPESTAGLIRKHLDAKGYNDITLNVLAKYPASRTPGDSKIVSDLMNTYREFNVEPQVWPLIPSATPYYIFSDILEIPYIWGGLGKAGNSHSENEFVTLEGLKLFEKSIVSFLLRFGKA